MIGWRGFMRQVLLTAGLATKEIEMHIWVVEILSRVSGKWEPCAEARLTKQAAQQAVKEWHERNPTDDFRARKYTPAPK